jgi:3-deoxy-D-manno-octulosonic-acid transferase
VADAAGLAAAAGRLLADPALREHMGENARRFVEAHGGSLTRLLALIEPLLAAGAAPAAGSGASG